MRTRVRSVTRAAECGGASCPSQLDQSEPCDAGCCPVDCVVGQWGGWGSCSVSCGGGTQQRTRPITTQPSCNGGACPAVSQNQPCNSSPCPVDCSLTAWSNWSVCNVQCGQGEETRSRSVAVPPANGGASCDALSESRACMQPACSCQQTQWSTWSACSESCGTGSQSRTRSTIAAASDCGPTEEDRDCNTQPCPVDCVVGNWQGWGACSAQCGGGLQSRSRDVITAQVGSGAACPELSESRACNETPCTQPTPAPTPEPTPAPTLPPTPEPTPFPPPPQGSACESYQACDQCTDSALTGDFVCDWCAADANPSGLGYCKNRYVTGTSGPQESCIAGYQVTAINSAMCPTPPPPTPPPTAPPAPGTTVEDNMPNTMPNSKMPTMPMTPGSKMPTMPTVPKSNPKGSMEVEVDVDPTTLEYGEDENGEEDQSRAVVKLPNGRTLLIRGESPNGRRSRIEWSEQGGIGVYGEIDDSGNLIDDDESLAPGETLLRARSALVFMFPSAEPAMVTKLRLGRFSAGERGRFEWSLNSGVVNERRRQVSGGNDTAAFNSTTVDAEESNTLVLPSPTSSGASLFEAAGGIDIVAAETDLSEQTASGFTQFKLTAGDNSEFSVLGISMRVAVPVQAARPEPTAAPSTLPGGLSLLEFLLAIAGGVLFCALWIVLIVYVVRRRKAERERDDSERVGTELSPAQTHVSSLPGTGVYGSTALSSDPQHTTAELGRNQYGSVHNGSDNGYNQLELRQPTGFQFQTLDSDVSGSNYQPLTMGAQDPADSGRGGLQRMFSAHDVSNGAPRAPFTGLYRSSGQVSETDGYNNLPALPPAMPPPAAPPSAPPPVAPRSQNRQYDSVSPVNAYNPSPNNAVQGTPYHTQDGSNDNYQALRF